MNFFACLVMPSLLRFPAISLALQFFVAFRLCLLSSLYISLRAGCFAPVPGFTQQKIVSPIPKNLEESGDRAPTIFCSSCPGMPGHDEVKSRFQGYPKLLRFYVGKAILERQRRTKRNAKKGDCNAENEEG